MITAVAEPAGFDPKSIVGRLTERPGVYQLLGRKADVLYVGKAKNLRRRVASYFSGRAQDAKTTVMLRSVHDIAVTVTRTEAEALILESELIKRHRPRFNVVLRDDKSYPYVHVSTDQAYPRLRFYRGAKPRTGRLFGPYPSAGSVRETLSQLQKLFRVRLCEDSYFANRSRPCLQHQIGRCTAPCVGLISSEDYRQDIEHAILFLQGRSEAVTENLAQCMEQAAARLDFERAAQYRDQISRLNLVQNQRIVSRSGGDLDILGLVVEQATCCVTVMSFRGSRLIGSRHYFPSIAGGTAPAEIVRAFVLQYYGNGREAPGEILVSEAVPDAESISELLSAQAGHRVHLKWRVRGDRARWLGMAVANAQQALALKSSSKANLAAQFEALAAQLGCEDAPARLECFDVSHTAGGETVASCVVFGPEGPLKSEYRRFNIGGAAAGDDYAALGEALKRRYARIKKGQAPLPDVLFIDGGRGQLNRALDTLQGLGIAGVRLVAVAKGAGRRAGHERLFVPGARAGLRLPPASPASHLVQQVRDEAHRFALTGHRSRRGRQQTASPLLQIAGLGPRRRSALLRRFGGLQGVARAGVEDLQQVRGISARLAQDIYEQLHGA